MSIKHNYNAETCISGFGVVAPNLVSSWRKKQKNICDAAGRA